MTNWTDQITEFQNACMEQQQQMLSGWMGAMQKASSGSPQNVWHQALDTLEHQVDGALDTQQQSFKALIKTIEDAGNSSPEITQWEHQADAGMNLWFNMQHQLWKAWFEMLRNASPAKQSPGEILAKNWQDMMQQAVSMQEQWLSSWAGGESKDKVKSGKQSNKTST